MGAGLRTSCLGQNYLSCLENKKITILKPVYLVNWKDKNRNSYYAIKPRSELLFSYNIDNHTNNSFCNCIYCSAKLIIKINSSLVFKIMNIECYEIPLSISQAKHYEIFPLFLNNTDNILMSNIEIIKASDKNIEVLNETAFLNITNVFFSEKFFINNNYNYRDCYENNNSDKERLEFIAKKYSHLYIVEDL